MSDAVNLKGMPTPSLILDERIMLANIDRLDRRMADLNVSLRPHLKTVKSVDAARRVLRNATGATVSTLKEAEVFAAAGIDDILYCVGISPQKLPRVLSLRAKGCDLTIILDSVAQAHAVAEASREAGDAIPVLIEIDCDGHRSGLHPENPALVEIGRILVQGGAELRGVVTHAARPTGQSARTILPHLPNRSARRS